MDVSDWSSWSAGAGSFAMALVALATEVFRARNRREEAAAARVEAERTREEAVARARDEAAREAKEEAERARARASHTSLPTVDLGLPRVLLVDDEQGLASVMRHEATELGCQVLVARSKAEAREVVRRLHVDLLVVDLRLPDGDGLSLLDELRPRTLVYSGAPQDELDHVRAMGLADCVLEKDGDLGALTAAIREQLRLSNP